MNLKDKIKIILLIVCFLFTSSCATVITSVMPPTTFVKKGDVKLGPVISYDFNIQPIENNIYRVIQIPICEQEQRVFVVQKKQTRGPLAALVELPIFGLGLVDWVVADAVAQNSKKVVDKGYVPTGEFKKCGAPSPAKGIEVVVQFPLSGSEKKLYTDENGNLDLNPLFASYPNSSVNLFVRRGGMTYYLTSIYVP